jgi:hypothetical protein
VVVVVGLGGQWLLLLVVGHCGQQVSGWLLLVAAFSGFGQDTPQLFAHS